MLVSAGSTPVSVLTCYKLLCYTYSKHKLQKTQNLEMLHLIGTPFFILPGFADIDLEASVHTMSLLAVAGGSAALALLIGLAIARSKQWPHSKATLFALIVLIVTTTTLIIGGNAVYLNMVSATGGPVHWQADVEFWACGNQLNLRDPQGFTGRIGTPTLYERNDGRIHVDGVSVRLPLDASLGKFMQTIGGKITGSTLLIPLNDDRYFVDGHAPQPAQVKDNIVPGKDGMYGQFASGQSCGGQTASLQVFVYTFNSGHRTYAQTQLTDPANYEISHQNDVPPGDCIIVQFGPETDHTGHICQGYEGQL
jgi:hypothetical protein